MHHLTLIDFACNGGGSAITMTQSSSEQNVAVNEGTGDAGIIEIEVLLLGSQKTRTIRRKKDRRREKNKEENNRKNIDI